MMGRVSYNSCFILSLRSFMIFSNIRTTIEAEQPQINNTAKFSAYIQAVNENETKNLKIFLKKITTFEGSWAHYENNDTSEATAILSPMMNKKSAQKKLDRVSKSYPNLVEPKLYKSTSKEEQYRLVFKPKDASILMAQENVKKNPFRKP